MKNPKLYKLDKQGNLNFLTHNRLHKDKYKEDSVWNQTWLLMVIVAACIVADYASFSSLFASFLYDNALLRNICIIALVLAFEISPVYLGAAMKKRACGYHVEKISMIIPLLAFVLGVIINLILRLATHELTFPDLSGAVTSMIGGTNETESTGSQNSVVYACFFAILPVITSLVAFAASYAMSDPLKKERAALEKTKIELTRQIGQLESMLAEYGSDESYLERLLADDESKFNTALMMIHNQRDEFFDYARQKISEHLASPAATSYVVDYGKKSNFEEDI